MPTISDLTGVILAVVAVATLVLALWWRRRDQKKQGEDARREALTAARRAAARAAERWRLSMLSGVHAYQDPDLRQVLNSTRDWRREAADDLVAIKAACPAGSSEPARRLERGTEAMKAFQVIVEPLAAKYQPDMRRLYQDDPAWKEEVDEAIKAMQAAMAPILSLDALTDAQLTTPEAQVE